MNSILTNNLQENLIENYIYLYHLDKFVIIPTYPDSFQDSLTSTFTSSTPLSRSAPIFSYSNSGPRTLQINLSLHRDMMQMVNYGRSNINVALGDDYVDTIIKNLQACALPSYKAASKMVNPPSVAVRFGNEIFIKGIVQGGVTVTYKLPLLENNKYALVDISFQVIETDPYDAESVAQNGSFRGLDKTIERRLYK